MRTRLSGRSQYSQGPLLLPLLAAGALCVLLSGCGSGLGPATVTGTGGGGIAPPETHYNGSVYGGQQPVSGATIQLYTVGTTANGSAATPLISSTITTNSSGQFTITGKYSCASATEVYLVATGGNSGGGSNPAIALMALLGPCSALTTNTFTNLNELTTVAAAYALAPFMTDYAHVGASRSGTTGLVNAFNTANLLVDSTSGGIPTPPTGMTLPTSKIDTLANILGSCINSPGSPFTTCQQLMTATGASETIGAALAMAKSPGSSTITGLFSLTTGQVLFTPALMSQPSDFTLAINYTGTELSGPYGIAFDSSSNTWVTNEAGSSVVKVPLPSTTFSTTSYSVGGLLAPRGIAIGCTGNIWIANTGGNDVVELSGTGSVLSGSGYTGGGISTPVSIALDSSGNAWVANFTGNSITELSSTGTATASSPITGSGVLNAPSCIAVDPYSRTLVANSGDGQLCIFANSGTLQGCVNDGTLFGATAVASSPTGAVSLAGSTTGASVAGAFTLATDTGAVNASSPVSGTGGLALPTAVAYDSSGNAWFANTSSISEFSGTTALSPSTGYGSLNSPAGIAIDPSGNVWTTNSGDNSISIFVGLGAATPVATCVGGSAH